MSTISQNFASPEGEGFSPSPKETLTATKRTHQAIVEVITKDGTKLIEHGVSRGTVENPMRREEIEKKSRQLMTPVLGEDRTEKLIHKIWNLEQVKDMRELRPLLSVC
jgi:2-methylcitrate dehydratase PrpD